MDIQLDKIQDQIFAIRGHKVMLDSDLSSLYEVETGALNRQVRRNIVRFPDDFMFQLTAEEHEFVRCQNGISKEGKGGRRYKPLVFTESGIAMLSSVLKSERAVQVNILIMRTFIKLISYYALEEKFERKVNNLEKGITRVFKIIFQKLDETQGLEQDSKRRKIGLKRND